MCAAVTAAAGGISIKNGIDNKKNWSAAERVVPASTPIGRLRSLIIVKPGTNAEGLIGGA
jgi:hypothetical protein